MSFGVPSPFRAESPDAALSLYHLLDPDVLANPYPLFHRLRHEDPVHWDPFLHAWIVTRYGDVVEVLHSFSADRTPTPEQLTTMGLSRLNPIASVMVKQMLFMDAPAHTRLRGLASKAFTPARVEILKSHIRDIVDNLLDAVQQKGSMDVIADLAEPLPAIVTAEMLGVPVSDRHLLKTWSANFAEMLGNFQHNPDHAQLMLRTVEEMTSYFREAVHDIKEHSREGLIHSLLTAEMDGDRLTEEEVVANAIVTMVGGQETTTNLIGNGLLTLLRHPEEMVRLRSDLSLIPCAVEEMLRYESPSQHTARIAPSQRQLGSKTICRRQAVIAVMAAANRDPERFPDPDRFDIARKDNRHLAFGYAAHFCFGAPLARTEGQLAFERMLRRFHNLRLEPQKLVWRSNLGLRGLVSLKVAFDSAKSKGSSASGDGSEQVEAPVVAQEASSSPKFAKDAATRNSLLEKYLNDRARNASPRTDTIRRRPEGTIAPLSLAQEELWHRERWVPRIPPLYNECVTLYMSGPLDATVLERSFTEIIRRHEIWRTTFETKCGQPVQVVHRPMPVQLPIVDLRDFPQAEREAEAIRRVGAEVRRPFQFESGPALRPMLLRMDNAEHRFYLIAHQMVLDGLSAYQIFPSELAILYKAFATGKPSPLPDLPLQCSDFASWHREWVKHEAGKQLDYWRKQLGGNLSALAWPNQQPRTAVRTFRGALRSFALPKELSEKVKQLSRQENSTLFLTLLAGFTALLYRHTKQKDIVVGTISPCGRKRSEFVSLLGYFLNPVALRLNLGNEPTFRELLAHARTVMSEAIYNDDIPIERLGHELKPGVEFKHNPFFTVAISLQPSMPDLGLPWSVTTMDAESGGSPWDLYLAFIDRREGLIGRVQFNPDLFETGAIAGLLHNLEVCLRGLTANVMQRLSKVNFLNCTGHASAGAE